MRIVVSVSLAAFSTLGLLSAANAAISSRAECYDVVIAACNQTAHPTPCAENGMDQCDKEFPSLAIDPKNGIGTALVAPAGNRSATRH